MFVGVFSLPCTAAAQVPQFFSTSPAVFNWINPTGGVVADFDRDGSSDLCVSAWIGPPLTLFRNDGLGDLAVNPLPALNPSQPTVAFVDFDGDGDRDMFVSWPNSAGSNVALFRYVGGGAWLDASASLPLMQGFTGIVVADLDGDGDEDLAGCGHPVVSGAAGILTNTNGVFTFSSAFGGLQVTIAGADFDGDGDVDIATTTPLQLWRNDGGMVFTNVSSTQLPPLPAYSAHLAFADVDGDGDQDLVLGDHVNYVNPFDRLLVNNGSGTFVEIPGAIPPHPGVHTLSVALADVDEDGDLDLIRGGNPPHVSLNDGTGLFTLAINRLPPLTNVTAIVLPADLDRDGDVDLLLLRYSQPGQILWNRHRHVTVPAPPAIGQSWTVELWGQPGYGVGTRTALLGIGLARLSQPVVVPPFGTLWLDLGVPFLLQPALIAPAAGAVPLVFAIPPAPSIVGVTLHMQALIEETAGVGDVRLTPLVSTTIQ